MVHSRGHQRLSAWSSLYPKQLWAPGISASIQDVDPVAVEARQNQTIATFLGVTMAAGADVPSAVVQLIAFVRGAPARNDL